MNTETQITTPVAAETSESHAAAGSPSATSPANQEILPRRERDKPVYYPMRAYPSPNPEAKTNEQILVDEDAVRLDYEFVLRGGKEVVVRVKSQLILPMALALVDTTLNPFHGTAAISVMVGTR